MSQQDDDPIQPKPCPNCCKTDRVDATTPVELRRMYRHRYEWFCDLCNLYFDGTATEAARYASKRIADAATNGTIR